MFTNNKQMCIALSMLMLLLLIRIPTYPILYTIYRSRSRPVSSVSASDVEFELRNVYWN